MTIRYKTYAAYAAVLFGLAVAFAAVSHARGGEGCCGSKSAATTRTSRQSDYGPVHGSNDSAFLPPHGGQLSKLMWHQFEVVYGAQETRVYLYDIYRSPVSTRGIQGHAIMRVRSNGREFRYPLHVVAVEYGQDYLVASVNLTRVLDGDMDVHYELADLPNREAPTAKFSQVFFMTRSNGVHPSGRQRTSQRPTGDFGNGASQTRQPFVSVTEASVADRAAVAQQQNCPVTGTTLGEHGNPIKVTVNGQSLFLCCRGCVDTVVKSPELHFQRLAAGGPLRSSQLGALVSRFAGISAAQ